MKKMLVLAALAASCLSAGAVKVEGPLPIPVDRQEQISRKMIALQQKQIAMQAAVAEAKERITQTTAAEAAFGAMVEALRKEFHAESCPGNPGIKPDLPIDKTWQCPPADIKPKEEVKSK